MHENQIKLPKASVIHLLGVQGQEKPIFQLLRLKPTFEDVMKACSFFCLDEACSSSKNEPNG
jgi:hypothetical protein